MTHYTKSKKWTLAMALLVVTLCLSLFIGAFAFAQGGDDNVTPSYNTVIAELTQKENIPDDHTAETIKSILTVTGVNADGTTEPIDKTNYSVKINGDLNGKLLAGETNVMSVVVGGTEYSVDMSLTTVIAAEIVSAELTAIDGYELQGDYYINADGFYAFTQGMTDNEVKTRLQILVAYPNHVEKIAADSNAVTSFVIEGGTGTTDITNSERRSVNIGVTVKIGEQTQTLTKEFSFRRLEYGALEVRGYTPPANFTSDTYIDGDTLCLSSGSGSTYVYAIWNNGNSSTENIPFEHLGFSGLSFAPTGEAIKEALTSDDVIYDSTIEIPYTGSNGFSVKPLSLTFNVKYTAPHSISSKLVSTNPGNTLKNQEALSDKIDVDGIVVEFEYAVDTIQIPLSEFDGYTFAYFTNPNGSASSKVDNLTREVKLIKISATIDCKIYDESSDSNLVKSVAVSGNFRVTIDRKPIDRPTLETNQLEWSDAGCSTKLTLPDVEEKMDVTTNSPYAVYENGVLTFKRGGVFTVSVSLQNQDDRLANVYFSGNTNYYDSEKSNDYSTVFQIKVDKAQVTTVLDGYETERQYGDNEGASFAVRGEVEGNSGMNFTSSVRKDITDQQDSEDKPSYQLYYFKKGADENTATTEIPTKRGTYCVYAKTAETAFYQEGKSETSEFEITHRYISVDGLNKTAVFDNTVKELGDFLNLPSGSGVFAYDDTLENVLALVGTEEIKHAKKYAVELSFKDGQGENYAWAKDDCAAKNIEFEITPARLYFTATQNSFTYGEAMPDANVNTNGLRNWVGLAAPVYSGTANDGTEISNSTEAPVNAGIYTVTYKIATSFNDGVLASDVTCADVTSEFYVYRKEITKLEIDLAKNNTSYTGSQIEFAIKNWNVDTFVGTDTYASIMSVTATGVLRDGTTNVSTSRITTADGKITVIDAGVYSFAITLGANYTWSGAVDKNAAPEEIKAENVTINKAKLSPVLSETAFKYDGECHVPSINGTLLDSEVVIDGFTYAILFGGEVIADETTIINAGTYTVSVTDFTIDTLVEDGTYSYKVNYELTENPFDLTFDITTPFISKPQLKNGKESVTETYKGSAYDFTAYIANYTDYLYGADNGQKMLKIVISGEGSLLNAGAYTVSVTPEENFRWSDGLDPAGDGGTDAVEFTFTVDKKAIIIDWTSATLQQVYDGSARVVTGYVISSKCGTDDIDVDFTYTANAGASLTEGKVVNVGTYTVTATNKMGGKSDNYKLDGNASLTNNGFEITPFKISAPAMNDASASLTFGKDTVKSFAFNDYTSSVTGFDWSDVLNVSVVGAWKFGGFEKSHNVNYTSAFVFGSATEATFTFANAGTYSFEFVISNGNFVWDDGITGNPTAEFTVERATIEAPSLGNARAMEWTKPITELNTVLTGNLNGVTYGVLYGKRNGTVTPSATQADVDRAGGSAIRGQYYALLTINGDNAWNYVWEAGNDGIDEKGNPIFIGGNFIEESVLPYAISYSEDYGAQISLYYAITASQVTIKYAVNNYLFGANGFIDGTIVTNENSANVGNTLVMDNSGIPTGANIKNTSITFYVQGSTTALSEENGELVNGLPWKAGTYDVKITIDFSDSSTYQQWNSSGLTLTVLPRPIIVTWSLGEQTGTNLNATFKGDYFDVVPSILNMPKKSADDETAAPTLTCDKTGNNRPFNAGSYTLFVDKITGDGVENFTKDDGVNLSCSLVIARYNVTVEVTGVNNHVYGDTIKDVEKVWTSTGNGFFNNDGNGIVIKLFKKDSADTTDYANNNKAPAGTYVLTPEWNGAAKTDVTASGYTLTTTNYVITVNTAEFVVVPRKITVTFKNGASSTYGATVNLYQNSVYETAKTNGVDSGVLFDEAQTVFTLSALKDSIEASNRSDIGLYALSGEQVAANGNYTVVFANNGVYNYEITNASMTGATVTSGHESGVYDGTAYPLFKDNNVNLVNDDIINAKWWFKEVGAADDDWTEFTNQTRKDVIDVEYQIKVTADNHNDLFLDDTVTFVISKKRLTVQINFRILFGERSPADFDGRGSVYNVSIADASMYTVEGFADGENISNILGLEGVFNYTTNYTQGADAGGEYYLRFVNDSVNPLSATNYEFVNKDGVLTVDKLVLRVEIDSQEAFYGTTADDMPTLTYKVEFTQKNTYTNVLYTESDRGTALKINQDSEIFVISTDAYNPDGNIKDVIGNGGYVISGAYVDETVKGNYDVTFENGAFTVKQTTNEFNMDFAFDNGAQYENEKLIDAWVYGLYADEVGKQKITEPQVRFGSIKSYLYKEGVTDALNETAYESVSDLFDALQAIKLGAGKYRLHLEVAENDNYKFLEKDWYFDVAKKEITVNALNVDLTYGDKAPEFYSYEAVGLVNGETTVGILGDGSKLTVAYFTSTYSAGKDFGFAGINAHEITHNNAASAPDLENYEITEFIGGTITVSKRTVTITIDDQKNTYNLQGGETAQTLTFTIDGTLFFGGDVTAPDDGVYTNGNQNIITLITAALTNAEHPDILTNNVIVHRNGGSVTIGGYAIYAEYNDITDGGDKWSKNYEIKFKDCSFESEDGIKQNDNANNAGLYTIEQAEVSFNAIGSYGVWHRNEKNEEVEGLIYSGAVNYYKAELVGDAQTSPTYRYVKVVNGAEQAIEEIVDVGTYRVYIGSSSDNYKSSGTMGIPIPIGQATLTLKADPASVQYGTVLSGSEGTDTLNGRFSGFTYVSSSDTLLPDILNKYLTDNTVTFTLSGYDAKTSVGANCFIIPKCKGSDNIQISADATTKLTVVKRQVNVTVRGFTDGNADYAWGYYQGNQPLNLAELSKQFDGHIDSFIELIDGEAVTFGNSGDSRTALSVHLNLPSNAINVIEAGYKMSVSSDAENYDVTFVTADGRNTSSIESADSDAPVFMVKKAPLVIYAHTRGSNNTVNTYSVVYGNEISGLTYSVEGMKLNESFEGQLTATNQSITHKAILNGSAYAPWESKVGQTYTVSIDKLENFANYDLSVESNYVTTTLAITPRQISVSTPSTITYDKAADGYHGGAYGKAHEAAVYFDYNVGFDSQNDEIDKNYRPVYKNLTYNTTSSVGQTAGKAPTKVGSYTVTIELNDANYTFASGNSKTLSFSVVKRSISEYGLMWNESVLLLQEGGDTKFTNFIANYVDDIMEVVTFSYSTGVGSTQLNLGGATTLNSYYFNENGQLCAYVEGRGTYTVQFRLKNTAVDNYEFDSRDGTLVTSYFSITSSALTMTLSIEGWQYNDAPKSPVTYVNGVLMESGVIYTYALITGNFDESLLGHDLTNIDGIARDPLSSNVTFNAGYYVLCAVHDGEIQNEDGSVSTQRVTKYYIFQVTKRGVAAPSVNAGGYKFNGQEQSLTVKYDDTLMRASYDGRVATTEGGIVVYATNAGEYKVKFTLVNGANYKWNSDADAVDGVVTLSWNIAIDDAKNNGHITVSNYNEAVFGSVAIDPWTVKQGYGNHVTVYCADRSKNQTVQEVTNWTVGLPVGTNVGDYWIKLVLSDGGVNFTDKEAFAELTVKPLEIYATAVGRMTYGDDFETHGIFGYTVSGLLFGNKVTETAVKYVLAEDYGVLQAGGNYFVLLDADENGIVKGLSAGDNYVIKAVRGELTVNRRSVTVTIGNASSQYGEKIDLSGVSVTYSNNLPKDGLKVEITTDATEESVVNGYLIYLLDNYDDANYNVTVNYGTYTVMQRQVSVTLTAGGGEYASENITPVSYSQVLDRNGQDILDFVKGKLTLTVTYTGVANSGESFTNSTVMPKLAGTYIATVRGSGNANFIIVGEPFTKFVITQKEVDASKLVIANAVYDKQSHKPVVSVPEQYRDMFYFDDNGVEKLVFTQDEKEFTNAATHIFVLTLNDEFNYKWKSSDVAEREVQFVIEKADNELIGNIAINGWQFGDYDAAVNSPNAEVKFGGDRIVFTYSSHQNGVYTSGAPERSDVGTYWVRVTVAEDAEGNYKAFESAPVSFQITRKALNAPTLSVVSEGENKNDVYTGGELYSSILGFDMTLMDLGYEGHTGTIGGNMVVYATNAGTYVVTFTLVNDSNYRWANAEGNKVQLSWTIERQKVAKPTANTDKFMVNGKTLTYLPVGFDEEIMTIEGNQSAYGGTFTVSVGLKDTANFVWEDGTFDNITFDWNVTGVNTVFTIVVSVLSGASAAMVVLAGVQILLDRRKKRLTDKAIDERSKAEETQTEEKQQGGNE